MVVAEEVERELQLDKGAHVTGDLNLAGGQGMPGLEVPQLHRDEDAAGPSADQPEPVVGFAGAGVQGDKQLQCPGNGRGGRRVPLCHPQRDRVEHDVHRTRRPGTKRRGARRPGRLPHAAEPAQIAGIHRGYERL